LQPGTWAEFDRSWKNGDHIELSFDMPLRLVPLDALHPNLVALVHGPVALFAIEPGAAVFTAAQLLAAQQSGSDWRVTTPTGPVPLRPFPAIDKEHYRLYQQI